MSTDTPSNVKTSVHETIDSLLEDATWDDVMDRIYVRQRIEAGLRDMESNNVVTVSEVRQRFLLGTH